MSVDIDFDASDFDDTTRHMHRKNPDFVWKTDAEVFTRASKWALIATEPAMTTTHIDAAGLATVIEMWCGMKKWYIGDKKLNPTSGCYYDSRLSEWESVLLRPGDWL